MRPGRTTGSDGAGIRLCPARVSSRTSHTIPDDHATIRERSWQRTTTVPHQHTTWGKGLSLVIAVSWLLLATGVGRGMSAAVFAGQTVRGLAAGKFLVASRYLNDPHFLHAVVLIIQYTPHGAMGLVVNRPTEVRLARVLPEIPGLRQRSDTVFIGGPVAGNHLFLLIRSHRQPAEARRIFDGVYVSVSRHTLQQLVAKTEAGDRFRVYAGYTGWAAGQLEHEVAQGDWFVVSADAAMVFDKAPAEIWPALIRKSTLRWLRYQNPVPVSPMETAGAMH